MTDGSQETEVSEAADDFLARVTRTEQPEVEDYALRYPRVAEILRNVLPALRAMQNSDPSSSGKAGRLPELRFCVGLRATHIEVRQSGA